MDINTQILVVEDSYSTRIMIVETLSKIGFKNVIEAIDGQDALQKLEKENEIGLIITDWNMPNIDGYELTRLVKANNTLKHIPIIIVSAQSEKEKMDELMKAGANAYLAKPFSYRDILETINKVLSKYHKSREELNDNSKSEFKPKLTEDNKVIINVAHLQVTDHLVLGVLKYLIKTGKLSPRFFQLETQCMQSWNPVYESLETGVVEAALILAPMAMDLFHYGVPIKLILLAHKNGSTLVKKKETNPESLKNFFKSKIFLIPHLLSVQYMISEQFFKEIGLKMGVVGKNDVDVYLEVVPPVNMPEYIKNN